MGIVVGLLVNWKCAYVVYYVYKATFVEIDVVVLYIGAAWIDEILEIEINERLIWWI